MQINISQTLRVYNSRIHKIKNVKFSGYCFYMNLNAWGDFQISCTFKNSMTWKRGFKTFRNWAGDRELFFFFFWEAEGIFAGGLIPHYMPCMSWNSNKLQVAVLNIKPWNFKILTALIITFYATGVSNQAS